jgi:ribonucleotide monophosphatase NagD (HAD superfamily)
MAAGLQGLLVRTGKYQAGDERELAEPPHLVAGNLAEAVTYIIDRYS